MPNGKPGDHPYTDVVVHGRTVFGPPIDDLIRQVAASGGCPPDVRMLLLDHEPHFGTPDREKVEVALRRLLAQRGQGA